MWAIISFAAALLNPYQFVYEQRGLGGDSMVRTEGLGWSCGSARRHICALNVYFAPGGPTAASKVETDVHRISFGKKA